MYIIHLLKNFFYKIEVIYRKNASVLYYAVAIFLSWILEQGYELKIIHNT